MAMSKSKPRKMIMANTRNRDITGLLVRRDLLLIQDVFTLQKQVRKVIQEFIPAKTLFGTHHFGVTNM